MSMTFCAIYFIDTFGSMCLHTKVDGVLCAEEVDRDDGEDGGDYDEDDEGG